MYRRQLRSKINKPRGHPLPFRETRITAAYYRRINLDLVLTRSTAVALGWLVGWGKLIISELKLCASLLPKWKRTYCESWHQKGQRWFPIGTKQDFFGLERRPLFEVWTQRSPTLTEEGTRKSVIRHHNNLMKLITYHFNYKIFIWRSTMIADSSSFWELELEGSERGSDILQEAMLTCIRAGGIASEHDSIPERSI